MTKLTVDVSEAAVLPFQAGSALELDDETIQLTAFRRESDDLPWAASQNHQRIARPSRRRR